MVDIEERILNRIDNHDRTLSDHCIRITKIEQDHLYRKEAKSKNLIYLIAGIAFTEMVILAFTLLPLVPVS